MNATYPQVRHFLKRRAERALSSSGVGWVMRGRVRGKCLILAYHGIIPEGVDPAGERALFIPQRDFAMQLDALTELVDVVPLNQIDEAGDGRPRVAITFDDAYRGAVTVGLEELAKRRLPATIFVAPARLNGHVFWWDALAHWHGRLDDAIRGFALNEFRGSDERVRGWAAAAALPALDRLPPYAQTASAAELRAGLALGGITVGSHTWSHANLAALSATEVEAELEQSREWLRAEFGGKAIDWLAYPYGLASAEARRVAAKSGYRGALGIAGGWHKASEVSPFARPRLCVPAGVSISGFRARLLGTVRA
jgi:peptidoglycan/xylan/chitin deacetylase (PgdA/CDA1 family)